MQLDLAPQEIDYLVQVLTQRPLGEALPLFEKIRGQLQLQSIPSPQHAQGPGQVRSISGGGAGGVGAAPEPAHA